MADDLLQNDPQYDNQDLITKEQLIAEGFLINKKFLMVDSRVYRTEAFEYILQLADIAGSLVFVWDTKKIWANGKYFGGDIFEADLQYFTYLHTYDENGWPTGVTTANEARDRLYIKGQTHVLPKAIYNEVNGNNELIIDYDLKAAVNDEVFELDMNAEYNLEVVDNQITMNKYIPLSLAVINDPPMKEFDTGAITDLEIYVKAYGTRKSIIQFYTDDDPDKPEDFTPLTVTESVENCITSIQVGPNPGIMCDIPENTKVIFTFRGDDGKRTAMTQTAQEWGYGVWYGARDFGEDNTFDMNKFDDEFNKYVITTNGSNIGRTITIDQAATENGVFICPSIFNVTFTDTSTNLQGGWYPYADGTSDINLKKYKAPNNQLYTVYVTDNVGLGRVTWQIQLDR